MAKKRTPYSQTKEGKVNNLKWAYITEVKLGREADMDKYLGKMLDIIVQGTRFEEHVKAVRSAKQVRRKPRRGLTKT